MSDSTSSLVKSLTSIIKSTIADDKPITSNVILLYKSGTNLTPISLGKVSY